MNQIHPKPPRECPRFPGITVALYSTKRVENVAGAYRAAACFDAARVVLLEPRCDREVMMGEITSRFAGHVKRRTRREFRHQASRHVDLLTAPVEFLDQDNYPDTVIGVELVPGAIDLPAYTHPEIPVCFLFGPEDGSIPQRLRRRCHAFVRVPMMGQGLCLNLAACVNVILYDRMAQFTRSLAC